MTLKLHQRIANTETVVDSFFPSFSVQHENLCFCEIPLSNKIQISSTCYKHRHVLSLELGEIPSLEKLCMFSSHSCENVSDTSCANVSEEKFYCLSLQSHQLQANNLGFSEHFQPLMEKLPIKTTKGEIRSCFFFRAHL